MSAAAVSGVALWCTITVAMVPLRGKLGGSGRTIVTSMGIEVSTKSSQTRQIDVSGPLSDVGVKPQRTWSVMVSMIRMVQEIGVDKNNEAVIVVINAPLIL